MKSYYEIALSNLGFLEDSLCLCTDNYNLLSFMCQQIAEKMLKSVLESVAINSVSARKSHDLCTINSCILQGGVDLKLNESDLALLTDNYYTTQNPGKDYIEINEKRMRTSLHIMYCVVDAVNLYRFDNNLPYTKVSEKTLGTSTISSIDSVFNEYRNIYNFVNSKAWAEELGRLFEVFGTTDMATLARNIKDTFL